MFSIFRATGKFTFHKITFTNPKLLCLQNLSSKMTDSVAKQPRISKKIGTHSGTFHCDEALACYQLTQLPEYKDAEIVRTRDLKILDECDIVVDVGAVFDPSKHRYDHHQREFKETMNSLDSKYKFTTKLSSAGLVYFHFGHKLIGQILNKEADDSLTKAIFEKVYENFIEEIDAIDNGISQTEESPRYQVSTTLSSRVKNINPNWNEQVEDEGIDKRFKKAMELTGSEFMDRVLYYRDSWLPARKLVEMALEERHKHDSSGEIMVLEEGGCPWKDHLVTLEEELKIEPTIKYVLYTDQSGNWRVQGVPLEPNSFKLRVPLLEAWRGIRDDKLSELSGIPGCIFVHASGFIGGNKTFKGALEMAKISLNASK